MYADTPPCLRLPAGLSDPAVHRQVHTHPARRGLRGSSLFAAWLGGLLLLSAWLGAPAAAQTVAEPALERAIQDLVDQQVQSSAVGGIERVEIRLGDLDPRIRLTPCQRMEPFVPPGQRLWGAARIGVRCLQGVRPWQVFLPVQVSVWGQALVPATALAAGHVVAESDLTWQEVDWAAQPGAVFTDPSQLVGRTTTRPIPAGEPIRTHLVRAPLLFQAGATVRLRVAGPGFAVSAQGRALNQGLAGESVRVRLDSGRIVQGLAVDGHTVEVRI